LEFIYCVLAGAQRRWAMFVHVVRLLMQQHRPYALVIGGTDVNEHAQRAELRDRMNNAISASHAVVAMHPDLRTRFIAVLI